MNEVDKTSRRRDVGTQQRSTACYQCERLSQSASQSVSQSVGLQSPCQRPGYKQIRTYETHTRRHLRRTHVRLTFIHERSLARSLARSARLLVARRPGTRVTREGSGATSPISRRLTESKASTFSAADAAPVRRSFKHVSGIPCSAQMWNQMTRKLL